MDFSMLKNNFEGLSKRTVAQYEFVDAMMNGETDFVPTEENRHKFKEALLHYHLLSLQYAADDLTTTCFDRCFPGNFDYRPSTNPSHTLSYLDRGCVNTCVKKHLYAADYVANIYRPFVEYLSGGELTETFNKLGGDVVPLIPPRE
eukprot:TRINITY_DN9846_c0_g1_i1.p1 TRINITY_DN9846_c0_g1~~TRINITY_DN9846_c0_g1_i1.p1  ORF type:complete len:146 (-),score=23.69 TRINITY_DN9846_c0_g1_i1:104-541(-)